MIRNNISPQIMEKINTTLQILDSSVSQFHQHQAETTRLHESFLRDQHALMSGLLSVLDTLSNFNGIKSEHFYGNNEKSAPLQKLTAEASESLQDIAVPSNNGHHSPKSGSPGSATDQTQSIPSTISPSMNQDELNASLLSIVSEKTGYPIEMLELSMDMEADLGIDSIKRVEILGSMQEKYPNLPPFDPAVLSEMHTLGQIAGFISNEANKKNGMEQSVQPKSTIQPEEKISSTVNPSSKPIEDVTQTLLEIVSEKTGYPTEMLELSMDMEADLGIDSIKRVEILGAMQEKFPSMPVVDTAILSDMRTLGQIIAQMSGVPDLNGVPVLETPDASVEDLLPETGLEPDPALASDIELSRSLMGVVSEKTGYPVEMLEPDMDMEADLGIDSIKRVEILGAMQEKYPRLSVPDASRLSELRTIQQIIDSFNRNEEEPGVATIKEDGTEDTNAQQSNEIQQRFINLKSIPYPDRLEVKLPKGSVTILTDDGTDLVGDVYQNLMSEGHTVVVLRLAGISVTRERPLPENIHSIELNENSETALSTMLEDIRLRIGRVASFIHLDPDETDRKGFSVHAQEIVRTVFLLAKILKDDLALSSSKGFAAFLTVTRLDGQFGVSMSGPVEPVSAGLFGLTKTLSLEWEEVFCRAVDIQPGIPTDTAAEIILDELLDSNRLITETGHTKKGRFTLVVEQPESVA